MSVFATRFVKLHMCFSTCPFYYFILCVVYLGKMFSFCQFACTFLSCSALNSQEHVYLRVHVRALIIHVSVIILMRSSTWQVWFLSLYMYLFITVCFVLFIVISLNCIYSRHSSAVYWSKQENQFSKPKTLWGVLELDIDFSPAPSMMFCNWARTSDLSNTKREISWGEY